jgi:hypothetical protein
MGILKKRLKTLSSPKCKKIKNIYLRRLAERAPFRVYAHSTNISILFILKVDNIY